MFFLNKILLYFIEKNTTSFITVRFAAFTLVIVLTWIMCCKRHVV